MSRWERTEQLDGFLKLTTERRRAACEEAEVRLGLRAASIEKDFWVCWTLRELLRLEEVGRHLTFKGGTSLSKGWKLIDRFSEDLDLVLSREFLGFTGEQDPELAKSRKKQVKGLEELRASTRTCVRGSIRTGLEDKIAQAMKQERSWHLRLDEEDPDGQTLLFEYPASVTAGPYVSPAVRLEFGARSDTEPSERPVIRPYLADAFPDLLGPSEVVIRCITPRRTFWEKAMLLHEENSRKDPRSPKRRLSRHLFDLWSLIGKGIADQAVADRELRRRVAHHRAVFFRIGGIDYETLETGGLMLVPAQGRLPEWRDDFKLMREEMFIATAPDFEEIVRVVGEFEKSLAK